MKTLLSEKLTKKELLEIKALASSPEERRTSGKAILFGSKAISELPPSLSPLCIFTVKERSQNFTSLIQKWNIPHFVCTEEEMKKMSNQKNPEGIGSVIPLPLESDLFEGSRFVILEEIQDPGNLGTLVRSAYALGAHGVIFVKGGCDPFGEKALRASQGAIFHIPYKIVEPDKLRSFLKERGIQVMVADMKGEAIENYLKKNSPSKVALLLGNEGQGVKSADSDWKKVSIPMQTGADSLNVAIAGSIFMYLLSQHSKEDSNDQI